jgi:hypothetical protein
MSLSYVLDGKITELSRLQQAPYLAIDELISVLWNQKMDSAFIAKSLDQPEALVASRIPRIIARLKG